ncbi:MAG TPA: hypothetical protein VJ761_23835, partial [Ktedonobacteraceae bacterium]|nr:hypothetical protein [Ktedonobacteraceae bacterium]
KAVVHGHCHHKAIMKLDDEESLLTKLGLDYHVLDSGCCGMAGAFGFEREHYDLSIKAGERVLLPAVRHADKETLIIADGFSCREQIEQTTDRQALHVAQVIQMAMREGQEEPARGYPEAAYTTSPTPFRATMHTAAYIGAGACLLLAGGAWIGRFIAKRKSYKSFF